MTLTEPYCFLLILKSRTPRLAINDEKRHRVPVLYLNLIKYPIFKTRLYCSDIIYYY